MHEDAVCLYDSVKTQRYFMGFQAEVFDEFIDRSTEPELEYVAGVLSQRITNDSYASSGGTGEVLADFAFMERLLKRRQIKDTTRALKAVYRMFDDYCKPETKQVYALGQWLQNIVHYVFALELQSNFDISYLERAVKRAREDGHEDMAGYWERLAQQISRQSSIAG
ncbi:MAG: hypothetical protein HY513_04470 [Candidatus Aenigmarchaeota archaeon]|nr:hypothetical protein [Candidatus Aenigmarchaeota archaeon]